MKWALSFVVATVVLAADLSAQLQYRIGIFVNDTSPLTWGSWTALGSGTDVALGTLSASSDIVVHIADANPQNTTPPAPPIPTTDRVPSLTANLGSLRLIATAGSAQPLRVRVWIANKYLNPPSSEIDEAAIEWTPGVHDWTGSIECLLGNTAWTALRDRVRLNANLSHNYNNPAVSLASGAESIHCGSIIRFNVAGIQDDEEDVEAGQINGFLRGEFNYVPVGQSASSLQNAVGFVGARHKIEGAIGAGDAPLDELFPHPVIIDPLDDPFEETNYGPALGTATNLANIGSVRVGPNVQETSPGNFVETAWGVNASVAARRGVIREVLSTGYLMNRFEAGNGIWVIRQATAENNLPSGASTLAYNVDSAKHGMIATVKANLFTPGYLAAKSPGKGAIRLIEVVGPIVGSIAADNVYWNAPNEPSFDVPFTPNPLVHRNHRGILVWNGGITGAVDIRYNLEQADIIAAGLKGSCTIGLSARGSIVAYGTPDATDGYFGLIAPLSIGYTPDIIAFNPALASENPGMVLPAAYQRYSRGLRGSAVPPVAMPNAYGYLQWMFPHQSTNPTPDMVYDGGSVDCVVRFTATDASGGGGNPLVNIYNMHQYNPKPSNGENPVWRQNPYRPRVEAPMNRDEMNGRSWFAFQFGKWAN